MNQLLSGSSIVRLWIKLCDYFMASTTYRVLCILLIWCKNSKINNLIERYLGKNSSLKYSLTYQILSKFFSVFDKLWDRLFRFGLRSGKSSLVVSFIRNSFFSDKSFSSFALVILFFSFGFGTTSFLLRTFDVISIALTSIGILSALLLFIGKANWISILEGSIVWRFVLYIFD